ncbi:MAG: hypothetical protein ACI84K_001841 [Pseudohongiellaceae bacterium]|jgi:hypothetical protein
MRAIMYRINKISLLILIFILVSGCRVETQTEDVVLHLSFATSQDEHRGWAAATAMVFNYRERYYSQAHLVEFSDNYFGYESPSIDDISWLFWELGGLDSYVTGPLMFGEIRSQLNEGNPILLQYGGYYGGHYLVLHGYDNQGNVYIHEPGYGTRVMHYDDLYYRFFHNEGHYWESSLILLN